MNGKSSQKINTVFVPGTEISVHKNKKVKFVMFIWTVLTDSKDCVITYRDI
jgi:hypothetical protein